MNNFERTVNKWRTAVPATLPIICIDGNEQGKARATLLAEAGPVTVQSPDVLFEGDPFIIQADDLKTIKRIDNLVYIKDGEFAGDLTVNINVKPEPPMKAIEPVPGQYHVTRDDLDYVMLAASSDDTRPVLTSVLFTRDHLVSTDGYRLHFAKGKYAGQDNKEIMLSQFALKRIKSDFEIAHKDDHSIITFEDRGNQVTMKVNWIAGTFPDYNRVIPKECKIRFMLPDDKRFKKVIADKVGIAKLNGRFEYETKESENSPTSTRFEVQPEYIQGEPVKEIRFGINPQYLYEAAREWPIEIGYNQSNAPIMVGDSLVMPMHLPNNQ